MRLFALLCLLAAATARTTAEKEEAQKAIRMKTTRQLKEIFDGSSNKPKTQQVILEAVATLVTGKHSDALLKKTPAILMALYEIDLLEEAAVVKWHAKLADADEGFHSLEWREKVREAAAPFLKWLETAEEESSAAIKVMAAKGTLSLGVPAPSLTLN